MRVCEELDENFRCAPDVTLFHGLGLYSASYPLPTSRLIAGNYLEAALVIFQMAVLLAIDVAGRKYRFRPQLSMQLDNVQPI